MKYYAIAEVSITNPDWIPEYMANVSAIIEKNGGKYIARTQEVDLLEGDGDVHETSVILEFPSKEAAYAFYKGEEYKPFLDARIAGSKSRFYIIPGMEE